ncbi:MAG: adenylate/guanylate cyclase domain-containing protein [Alphaproteobacteria bacterium]|nr:adenylate/guanylate cyclase domain-containing protein [Alphaproteobacteria bacterium]
MCAACYIYIAQPRVIEPLQHWTFDTYQRLHSRVPDYSAMPAQVVIIDIDEDALAAFGQWPWPRTVMGQLVENLRSYGVLVTGFDIVFAEPDRTSPRQLERTINDMPDATRAGLAQLRDHDEIFAEVIADGQVVLGQVGERKHTDDDRLHPKARFGAKQTSLDAPPLSHLLNRYTGAVLNLEVLEAQAAGIGLFSTLPDKDGIYRKVAMLERIGGNPKTAVIFPALSLEMIRIALGGADSAFVEISENGIRQILLKAAGGGVFKIPTDRYGRIWVHFAQYPTGSEPLYVSAKKVLEKTADPAMLANKLAIVGTSAIGLKDIRATPINGQLPGVEVHAQVMETILSGSHLKREVGTFWQVPFTDTYLSIWQLELLSIFIGGMLMVILVPRLSALLTFMAGGSVICGLIAIGWFHYLQHQVLVDYAYPATCIFAVFFLLTYLNYMREEAQKKQIRHAFGHYVSPALLKELADNPEKLALGGETRELTILFSDIRGFTTISERFNAQELTRFINSFLTPMTDIILLNKGTVDKYMGDAIMAFWNAPLTDAKHPANACHAALQMQVAVKTLNEQLAREAAQVDPEDLDDAISCLFRLVWALTPAVAAWEIWDLHNGLIILHWAMTLTLPAAWKGNRKPMGSILCWVKTRIRKWPRILPRLSWMSYK